MKKKAIILTIFLLSGITLGATVSTNLHDNVRDVQTYTSYAQFDYTNLKNSSSTIALVQVKDNLTQDNSNIRYVKNNNFIRGYYGTRSVNVIKYYKNDKNSGDKISIIEPAAITKNNEYIHPEEYEKMEKGKEYIVFLSDKCESGKMSILSANNGKIDVSNIDKNERYDIAIKSILEYETPDSNISKEDKDAILKSEVSNINKQNKFSNTLNTNNDDKMVINTNFGELKFDIFIDENNQKEYLTINDLQLVTDKKLSID